MSSGGWFDSLFSSAEWQICNRDSEDVEGCLAEQFKPFGIVFNSSMWLGQVFFCECGSIDEYSRTEAQGVIQIQC